MFFSSTNYDTHAKTGQNQLKQKNMVYDISQNSVHRGSYMSALVLLNLLNEFGKRDQMRGLPTFLSLFRNEFNQLNNTKTRMIDSIYHMTLRLL